MSDLDLTNITTSQRSAPFFWTVRVYHEDVDTMGVVYHSNYLKYYERARTEYLRAAGFKQSELMQDNDIMFVVRSMQLEYVHAARYDDQLHVTAEVDQIKRSQFHFQQKIHRLNDQNECIDLINTADVKIVCVSASRLRPVKLPVEILDQLRSD